MASLVEPVCCGRAFPSIYGEGIGDTYYPHWGPSAQKVKNALAPREKIIDVTGHRNVLSLNSYEGGGENQAKELSNIISGCKQKSDIQKQTNSPITEEKLPLQASTSSNNYSTINNFTGTVNFCDVFPGFCGQSNMPMPCYQSKCTESQPSWKRIRVSI